MLDPERFVTLLGSVDTRFDPHSDADVLAAFALRVLAADALPEAMLPNERTASLMTRFQGRTLDPLALLYFVSMNPADDSVDLADDFDRRFVDVDSSLTLGALASGGLTAAAPGYSRVHNRDAEDHIGKMRKAARSADVHPWNIAAFDAPYTALRMLRMLTVPPTEHARVHAPAVAREHLAWCVDNYVFALSVGAA